MGRYRYTVLTRSTYFFKADDNTKAHAIAKNLESLASVNPTRTTLSSFAPGSDDVIDRELSYEKNPETTTDIFEKGGDILLCAVCGELATWILKTLFSGDHLPCGMLCEKHAEGKRELMSGYFFEGKIFWEKIPATEVK